MFYRQQIRGVQNMRKRKIWENFLQWILPGVLLVIALVLSIYDFNNKMEIAIQTVVDDQAEQIEIGRASCRERV